MADFFRIGEVSKMCDLSIKTLRYYEEFGLITPVKVDIYTGYRYYNSENIETLQKIQLLKQLGFSLQEIKQFDKSSIDAKCQGIYLQIDKLKNNLQILQSLKTQKGEIIMKPFINDEQAIGEWKYLATSCSKQDYLTGNAYEDKDIFMQELYFLPNGEGYWIFDRWTKGILYHFTGVNYTYEIEGNILFLSVYNENNEFETILVYEKVSSKNLTIDEISIKDNVELEFVKDEQLIGSWETVDYIPVEEKQNYIPKQNDKNLFLKGITIKPNGECIREDNENNLLKLYWTKDYIVNKYVRTASNYLIKEINNDKYLFMDWKSGDYTFAGRVTGCYVFKKI